MKLAANGTLLSDDIWPIDHNVSVRHSLDRPGLQPHAFRQGLLTGLGCMLWRNFWTEMMLSGLLALVNVATALAQPFFLQSLLEKSDMSSVCGLFSASIIAGATDAHMRLLLRKVGVQIRSALTALLCDGCMSTPKSEESTSDPTVLIEVDSAKIFELVEQYHLLWMVPLQATISIAALVLLLGWQSVLAGFLSPLVALPLIAHTTNGISRQMGLVMQAKDSRIALVTQVIKQVKQIKLGALQNLFRRHVDEQRCQELEKYKAVAFLNACMVFLVYVMPPTLISMTFGTAIFLGHGLPSNVVFPALAFCFNITRSASLLPRLVMLYQGGQISFSRIREFLLASLDEEVDLSKDATMDERPVEFGMRGCDIGFPASQDSPKVILQNCTMQATSNSLVIISGPIGCGKTTLIRSIIGEIKPHIGHIWVHGKMAYAPQIPFLICGTVRENILFGLPFDPAFYNQVLDAVSLRLDLARLPEGDATMLGGTGVALSGGQKSRVALARAVYARREVVVLDDPLAAVDAKVRSHLIHHVLGPQGILKDSLRIVATSSQALMSYSDVLYVIKNGSLSLAERPPRVHQHVTKPDQGNTSDEVESINNPSKPVINYGSIKPNAPISATIPEPDIDLESAPLLPPPTKTSPSTDIGGTPVRFDAYMRFLKLAKHGGWIIVLITAGASKLLDILAVFFLKLSSDEFERQGHSFKLAYYSACALLGGVLSAIFVLVAYYICVIPASRSIHAELTQGILEAKFSFFDTVNLGQILNRFTNDINKVDSSSYYLHACRQLRRLETLARGPILNIANEIRVGASVIMTFDQTASFKEQARDVIDDHIRVWAPFVSLDSWLILRLQLLSSIIQLLSAILLLWLQTPASTLGLVMNYLIQITSQFNTFVQMRATLEADMTSVERIWSYAANTLENQPDDEAVPSPSWPQNPTITFNNYSASYKAEDIPCLRGLTFTIRAGEHVAVVGRTGAGKSSLVLALLRALEHDPSRGGSITIDDVDIDRVNLTDLRRRITLLPQEPAIFSGTVRDNLDLEGTRTDEQLREALDVCKVRQIFNIQPDQDPLNYCISDSGKNLSGGQIQILALARAILAKNKIVVLDEATAAMDASTSAVIHNVIQHRFRSHTVITITHHIESALQHDKVLVMHDGRVAHYAAPGELLKDKDSILSKLVADAKIKRFS
ncbi:hypothetical protein BHE90_012462 [Fusarium euwallaceae]|uniref:Uncharacterized protein n=1 Tax=Fusarium euwallaceae TaxID=1147111 RepID=A0A430LBK1_9HYPO|nr:hypothetical protein BHE90_012462 [Fusarium euwallaceae]